LARALESGLHDAAQVAEANQTAQDQRRSSVQQLTPPPSDGTVAQAGAEMTQASQEMNTAYLGYQRTMMETRRRAVDATGATDRARLQQIHDNIETITRVGAVVDTAFGAINDAPAMVANVTETVESTGARLAAMANTRQARGMQRQTHNPTYMTVDEHGNMIVRNLQTGTDRDAVTGETTDSPHSDLSLPTSVSSTLRTIATFAYAGEVQRLNVHLEEIRRVCNSIQRVMDMTATLEAVQHFQDKLNDFALKANTFQTRLAARRQQYFEFGVQLDRFAASDAGSRGAGRAPGAGRERYATIMTVTSQIREVLSNGHGARDAFDSPQALASWAHGIEDDRAAQPPEPNMGAQRLSMPDSEWAPIDRMHGQVATFHSNTAGLDRIFAGVEAAASSLMQGVSQGGGTGEY
jgi:hypothetical protein